MEFKTLNNVQLQISLKNVAGDVRKATAHGIAMLAEVGSRELHLTSGYKSLFTYCVGELGLSKSMAWRWSKAAVASLTDDEIVAKVSDGRLSICVVATLADHPELLKQADGMTKDEADQKVASLKLYKARRDVLPPLSLERQSLADLDEETEMKKRMHVDVCESTLALAHRALALMPGKSLDDILSLALDRLLDARDPVRRHARREFKRAAKVVAKPKRASARATKRHSSIPLADRDAATAASGAQCEYTAATGHRCEEQSRCELDHIRPLAFGGADAIKNIRNLCHAHHRFLTKRSFPNWNFQNKSVPRETSLS